MYKFFITFILLLLTVSLPAKNVNNEKPKYLWFDAEANFERFSIKDSISYYLEKAKDVGFNQVVVDVKPIYGKVLYKSKYFKPLTTVKGKKIERDWDYLQYFIDEAHRLNLKVTVSTAIFTVGHTVTEEGFIFEEKGWDDKACIEYKPDGTLINIREDKKKVAVFLNPVRKDVREFALRIVREIVENYDVDSYALDYCRYPDGESDFSAETRKEFEQYIGRKVDNFPEDIYNYDREGKRIPGMYYKDWWAFRAQVISNFVKEVRETIHSINPEVKLEYWAASWIHAIYANGQNWASPKSTFALNYPEWGTKAYNETGFAPYLDNFLLGTYLERIYGKDDPESIEYGIARAKKLIQGDCRVFGTIYALNHKENIADAVKICLTDSEGLMVFDIVQVIGMDLWQDIRKGIQAAENNK